MTTNDEIRLLAEKFYSGETTEAEESMLRELTANAEIGSEHYETRLFFECCTNESAEGPLGADFDDKFRSRLRIFRIHSFRKRIAFSSAAAVLIVCSALMLVFSDLSPFGSPKGLVIDNSNAAQYEEESIAATLDALEILSSSLYTADEQLQTLDFIETGIEAAEDINMIASSDAY